MSHTLLILKIYTTFEDVQMMFKWFFDISTGFRFQRSVWECSVHICSCPWLVGSPEDDLLNRPYLIKKTNIADFATTQFMEAWKALITVVICIGQFWSSKTIKSHGSPFSWNSSQLSTPAHKCRFVLWWNWSWKLYCESFN